MKSTRIRPARRSVLAGLVAGAGAAAAAVIAGRSATRGGTAAPSPERTDDPGRPSGSGYRETAHIRNYYRTTGI